MVSCWSFVLRLERLYFWGGTGRTNIILYGLLLIKKKTFRRTKLLPNQEKKDAGVKKTVAPALQQWSTLTILSVNNLEGPFPQNLDTSTGNQREKNTQQTTQGSNKAHPHFAPNTRCRQQPLSHSPTTKKKINGVFFFSPGFRHHCLDRSPLTKGDGNF